MSLRFIVIFAFFFLIDIYAYQAFKRAYPGKIIALAYWISSLSVLLNALYVIYNFSRAEGPTISSLNASGWLLTLYVPKILIVFFLFGEDAYRLLEYIFHLLKKLFTSSEVKYSASRRKWISQGAIALAAVPFASMLYGILRGKYNFKVLKQELFFEELPDEFDGFTITQISDTHVGSFSDKDEIEKAIELINEQRSDLFVFTGDLVNNKADEMLPWMDVFSKINAPYGKYSILGNHDYGDYLAWPSESHKKANLEKLYQVHKDIGFNLLLNQNAKISKNSSYFALVGVENWGKRFKKKGDLNEALKGLSDEEFKILLSHDPSHWEEEVIKSKNKINLTLSGHTHGMQFGIEIPGIKWSPVQYVYKHWAGLFVENDRYLYVNRGFGFHAFPGRVGIWPEITVFTLRKKR